MARNASKPVGGTAAEVTRDYFETRAEDGARLWVIPGAPRPSSTGTCMGCSDECRRLVAALCRSFTAAAISPFSKAPLHPHELVEQSRGSLDYSALALTDECTVAGVVRAHEAAKDARFKFIVGSEFVLVDEAAVGAARHQSRLTAGFAV